MPEGAIRQKKVKTWLKEWKTKGTSQVVKYYEEMKIQPTTNVKSNAGDDDDDRKVLGVIIV